MEPRASAAYNEAGTFCEIRLRWCLQWRRVGTRKGKEGEGKGRKGKKEIMKERKKARKEEGRRTNSKTEGSSP